MPADLEDPSLVPLPACVEVADRLPLLGSGLAEARGAREERDLLRLDLDGDGRGETTVAAAKPRVVAVSTPQGERRLLVFRRLTTWYASPARLWRARVEKRTLEILDGDLDGDPSGPRDFVRWEGGAFQPHPSARRLAAEAGPVTYGLRREGEGWVVDVTPSRRPTETTDPQWLGLVAVNAFRNRAGLPPIGLDARRCAGCAAHARYILLNPTDGFGHEEIQGRPGFSEEGRIAAQLGVMERTADPAVAVGRLTRMMLHRTPFLGREDEPLGVGSVGKVTARPSPRREAGAAADGFTVLWAGQALASQAYPVVVPGPGTRDVPTTALGEIPEPDRLPSFYAKPRGYPVSIGYAGAGRRILGLRLHAADGRGWEEVAAEVFTPERPVHPSFGHNYATAFLVASAPLEAETWHVAEADVQDGDGVAHTLRWTFRTGP